MFTDDIQDLNDSQKQAVEYNHGPLLIVAGAGTGKTRVLVEKIKYLIKHDQTKPQDILALTFTEKAAQEMEERVDQAMPYGYFQMFISTFHSLADQILHEEAHQIGLSPDFHLLTDAESIIFLRKNLFSFRLTYFRPLGNPEKFLQALLMHFDRLRDEDINPYDYQQWVNKRKEEKSKYQELADSYIHYQKLKVQENLMDFGDLVFNLTNLFRQRPAVLKKYRSQYRHLLIDEFQDTNIAQYNLIKLLSPSSKNSHLTVVGDDSQAIYKFRGASVSNIMSFMKDYPLARQINLISNYRSNQKILDASYRLIKHNDPDTLESKLGISKKLIAQKKDKKGDVNFFLADSVEDEAKQVAKTITKLNHSYKYKDIAILVRANNHAQPMIRALAQAGIPYQFLGPGMLFKQPEIKDLIAYLKVLYNLEDSVSLYRVISMELFAVDAKDINLMLAFARKISMSLFQAIEIYFASDPQLEIYKKYLPFLGTDTKQKLKIIHSMIIKHLRLVRTETAGQILYYFLEDSGYLPRLVSYKTEKDEKIAVNISKFFSRLKGYEADHEDSTVTVVVDYLEMSMTLGESPRVSRDDIASFNAVNILTVHGAKGLEFPVVFMVNLSAGRFPPYEKKEAIPIPDELIKETLPEGDYHLEEERRLFYVGLTRTMDQVFLSASSYYGDGKRTRKLSPFVFETLTEEFVKKQTGLKTEEKLQLSIFDYKKVPSPPIKQEFPLRNFSFSQLESFEMCPLQYKYNFLLKIPTVTSAAVSFGDTIHKTLQRFYQEYMTNPSIGEKRLLEIYRYLWVPVGYSNKDHQKKMVDEGKKMLTQFFTKFHNRAIKLIALERFFKIKINDDTFITGKIDRVDLLKNGEIEIIDYKTGKIPDEKHLKKSLQLSIYALAATDKGFLGKKLLDVNLTFYFLQTMDKVTMKRSLAEMDDMKKNVASTIGQIRKGRFPPKVGPWCNFCSFRMICEAWQ